MSSIIRDRRICRNKLLTQIKEKRSYIQQNKSAIERFRVSKTNIEYAKNQIKKRKALIEEYQETIQELEKRVSEIDGGLADDELENKSRKTTKNIKEKHDDAMQRKKDKKKNDAIKKAKSRAYMDGIIKASRSHRSKQRDYKYGYKDYCRAVDTLPEYMAKNLEEMPNNKGYIWRGCYFYGKMPEQRGRNGQPPETIMFEKKKGGILIIHECDRYEKRIYEKRGRERRRLISRTQRKQKNVGNSLMDYLK